MFWRILKAIHKEVEADWNFMAFMLLVQLGVFLWAAATIGNLRFFIWQAIFIMVTLWVWKRGRDNPIRIIGVKRSFEWHMSICKDCRRRWTEETESETEEEPDDG